MSFRDNLIHLRATHNMTQEQLAMLIGVSRQAVTKWEAEKSYPEMDKLIKMCQIFNCTLDELVQGDLTARETPTVTIAEPSSPPADVFDYDKTMRRFGWKIPSGIAAIMLGIALSIPFFAVGDPNGNTPVILPENIATTLAMLIFFLGVIIGLALIIPAGLTHAQFVREHPFLEDFYTKEEKARARSSFCYLLIAGLASIFMGICSTTLFSSDSENVLAATTMLFFVAISVFLIVHAAMTLSRVDIARYNNEVGEYLEPGDIEAMDLPYGEKTKAPIHAKGRQAQ